MKQKVKSSVIETTIIILIIGVLFLYLPHSTNAQYGPFSYLAPSWGNPGLFQSPSFLTGFPMTVLRPVFPG